MNPRRDQGSGNLIDTPVGKAVKKTIAENALALSQAPGAERRAGVGRSVVADGLGKIWNAPNTVMGLGDGLAGHLAGEFNRLRPGDQPDPRVQLAHNAVEFIDKPLGGVSAITLGNTTTYRDDPYDPRDKRWYPNGEDPRTVENGHSCMEHTEKHTVQGQQLGPAYLPSNLLGGLNALIGGQDCHGPRNWNETGPQGRPSQPWPRRKPYWRGPRPLPALPSLRRRGMALRSVPSHGVVAEPL